MADFRVALVMTRGQAYVEQVMLGIAEHVHRTRRWKCTYAWDSLTSLDHLAFQPDGVICCSFRNELFAELLEKRVPAVNVWQVRDGPALPYVGVDDGAVGRLAAEYFMQRGFRHFAYAGSYDHSYSDARWRGFRAALVAAGHDCAVLRPSVNEEVRDTPSSVWLHVRETVSRWIATLPTPVAILAAEDICAVEVSEACAACGLQVPGDVAVLGVNNDRVLCDLAAPPLSSIELPGRQVGLAAAAALDRWLDGEAPSGEPALFPPTGVVTRQSTDVFAVDDRDVTAALQLIRDRATRGLTVEDILAVVPVSRRTLENRFARHLGRSPHAEIERVRIARAKDLLTNTDLSMPEVAARAGFNTGERLSVTFRRRTGQTPTGFRIQTRAATH
jgi:LacI family transcriptional regulator